MLHIIDIVQNSVRAEAKTIQLIIKEDLQLDRLSITVQDNGIGMNEQMIARVVDPFTTTRTTRKVGLGIPLLKAAAEMCNGSLEIVSAPGQGTRLTAEFQRSHIDRMPLGDVAGTVLTFLVTYLDIHWLFHYKVAGREFIFDDEPIKQELEGIPLTEPTILAFLREQLEEGIKEVGSRE